MHSIFLILITVFIAELTELIIQFITNLYNLYRILSLFLRKQLLK